MKTNLMFLCLSFCVSLSFANPFEKGGGADLRLGNLRCEYLVNPSGIDVTKPRLSWYSTSEQRNQKQSAYRILVASSLEKLNKDEGDLWDSKKVYSEESVNIFYNGKELASGEDCFWKVKIWNNIDVESEWSKFANWSMGLLNKTDWKGYWIGLDSLVGNDKQFNLAARYLRKEFDVSRKVKKATAFICGLGLFEMYFNGEKIGNQVLAPALSEYPRRSYYMTFNVTKAIRKNKNAIGVILGGGRYYSPIKWDQHYGFPKLIFQLNIEYSDGGIEIISSDTTWNITADGPITSNNEFGGEEYDAGKEMKDWNKTGFDYSKWMKAEKVSAPSEKLCAQMIEPIKIEDTIKPISITEIKPAVYVYDMGQNMVGWVSLKVKAKRGERIKLRFAERITPTGELDTANLRLARQTDIYTAKGKALEEWEPRFTYHGFRYVELSGLQQKPDLHTLEGKVINDDVTTTGYFNCSNEVINKVYDAAFRGIRGNYRSLPTDCPQRDERQAWLGDRSVGSLGESFIFDINALYSKWMTDISDGQKLNGSISDVSPTYRKVYSDNVTWPSSFIIIPGNLYRQFGNLQVIADNYDAMKRWIFYMHDNYMKDYLMPKDSYGDWCMVSENRDIIHSKDPKTITPGNYLGSAYYYFDLTLMNEYALLLNKTEDAGEFNLLSEKVKESINSTFFNKDSFFYANNTPTANLVALSFNIPPEEFRSKVADNIVARLVNDYNYHTSCGAIGQQWIMRTLTDNGKQELALTIAENKTYPGFGYMIENGATTIWELWNGNTAPPKMNSANHVMLLGDFIVWLFEDIAGIATDPAKPAFKNIIMKPQPSGNLTFADASYNSMYGMIKSNWKVECNKTTGKERKFYWDVEIPFNTSATVFIPSDDQSNVKESGKIINESEGVKFIKNENGRSVFEIGSGSYHFESEIKNE